MTDLARLADTPRRIQRQRTKGWKMPAGAIYVGRSTKWGNRWRIGIDGTAAECVEKYRTMLANNIWTEPNRRSIQRELCGHHLVCWCPLISHGRYIPCHGDVLLSIANNIPMDEVIRENTRWAKGETL